MKIWNEHLRLLDTEGLPGVSGKVVGPSETPCVVPVSVGVVGEALETPSVISVNVVGVVDPSVIRPTNDMKKKRKIINQM